MKVLVDTSIWSLALRRGTPPHHPFVGELVALIADARAQIIGPIRQELLSGIRSQDQFESLKAHLAAFPDLPLETADYEHAAAFFNICRRHGVQGSNTDFLICAAAARRGLEIFTADADFRAFADHIPIRLHAPAPGS